MLRKSFKGQSLTEFALILPLLLLLLLGIIEGGRIVWVYIAVQNSAKEAARYAVTGRPYYCPGEDPLSGEDPLYPEAYCDRSDGDPWRSQVEPLARVRAIENVAIERARLTPGETFALRGSDLRYSLGLGDLSRNYPGYFGVQVSGKVPEETASDYGQFRPRYPSVQGWEVKVETYFNVQMLDPIYDTLVGGQPVHLKGEAVLQNEGFDPNNDPSVLGVIAEPTPTPGGPPLGNVPHLEIDDDFNDLSEPAGSNFTVRVLEHAPNTTYYIWFVDDKGNTDPSDDYVRSATATTDNVGNSTPVSINIPVDAPPSPTFVPTYKIYATVANDHTTSPTAACAANNAPCFEVFSNNAKIIATNINESQQPQLPARWPISSSIPIYLSGHTANTSYNITVNGNPTSLAAMTNQFGSSLDSPVYYIATGHTEGSTLTFASSAASTAARLTKGKITLSGVTNTTTPRPEGDVLSIILTGLAPLQQYTVNYQYKDEQNNLKIPTSPTLIRANDSGNYFFAYTIPSDIHDEEHFPNVEIPFEIYLLDYNRGPNPNKIATTAFKVQTPSGPYINVPGGSTWPAGSAITIQIRKHLVGTYDVRMEQGSATNPSFSENVDVTPININASGAVDIGHIIPPTYAGSYFIRSFEQGTTNMVAELAINVTSEPFITIDDGNRWPPGATITIRLQAHAAGSLYDVWLDRNGPRETYLGQPDTDQFGEATIEYTIPATMPTKSAPGYPIHSYTVVPSESLAADNGELEVIETDLAITAIDLPQQVIFNTETPITLTVRNNSLLPIVNSSFDNDIYIDPLAPPDLTSIPAGLPPGNYKQWINALPANSTTTIQDTIVIFGQQDHQLYGRVDTSDLIGETDEISNNLMGKIVKAICPAEIIEPFDGTTINSGWTQTSFGNTGAKTQTQAGGILTLTNAGLDSLAVNDTAASAGYHLMHRPVGSGPFEVMARIDSLQSTSNSARAGLEIRANTGGSASKLLFTLTGGRRLQVFSRQTGFVATVERSESLGGSGSIWLHIRRNGDEFIFSYAVSNSDTPPDSWIEFETVDNFTLSDSVQVGLLNAPGTNTLQFAKFGHLQICATSAPGATPGTGEGGRSLGTKCGMVEENGNGLVVLDAVNTTLNQNWQTVTMNNVFGEPAMDGLQHSSGSPHAEYQVNSKTSGPFYVWVAGWGPDTNSDTVGIGLAGTQVGTLNFPTGTGTVPGWVKMSTTVDIGVGVNIIDLWGQEVGARVFKILLTNSPNLTPPATGIAQSACSIAIEPALPPGLERCVSPIRVGGFEGTSFDVTQEWKTRNGANPYSIVSYTGNRGAAMPSVNNTEIFQSITLPDWLSADAKAELKYDVGVYQKGNPTAGDVLKFRLKRESGQILFEKDLATGADTPDLDPVSNPPEQWRPAKTVDVFAGTNPLSVVAPSDKVVVSFIAPTASNTEFYLDNLSLTICTVEPLPAKESGKTLLTGQARRQSGQPIVGAHIWAYAIDPPGPVLETYSIQNGQYSFFNLDQETTYMIYGEITDESGTFFQSRTVTILAGEAEKRNIDLVININ